MIGAESNGWHVDAARRIDDANNSRKGPLSRPDAGKGSEVTFDALDDVLAKEYRLDGKAAVRLEYHRNWDIVCKRSRDPAGSERPLLVLSESVAWCKKPFRRLAKNPVESPCQPVGTRWGHIRGHAKF